MAVHPTAIVHQSACVHPDAEVAAYASIGAHVTLGARCRVGSFAVIEGPSTFGEDNQISSHVVLGTAPQDLKYHGEPTTLEVGDRNVFREFMTAHRGTASGRGRTIIGNDNLFMAYVHVAHDCVVGDRTVFANGASMAGHCVVEDDAILGGFAALRQFCRVGRHAFVGAFSPLNKDVLPFVWTASERDTKAWKVNSVGLSRKGFSPERITSLQKAYRVLHRHRHEHEAMLEALDKLAADSEDVRFLREFIANSKNGVHGA